MNVFIMTVCSLLCVITDSINVGSISLSTLSSDSVDSLLSLDVYLDNAVIVFNSS